MPRHDRKRWWESKPPPPKPTYYGIIQEYKLTGYDFWGTHNFAPILKPVYRAIQYHPRFEYYLDQKFTHAEAGAMCKILNAVEDE